MWEIGLALEGNNQWKLKPQMQYYFNIHAVFNSFMTEVAII